MTSHDQEALAHLEKTSTPGPAFASEHDWLARLAHDLRSPLVAIGYASQMLRSGRAPPQKIDDLFATIDRQTAQLARLAEEIGDMLLIGRGRFTIRRGHCDLVAIAREALLDIAAGTAPAATFAGGNAVGITCDRLRLVQLLRHILKLLGKRKPDAALPVIEVSTENATARLRIVDAACSIYRSDSLLFLAYGVEPQDPGIFSMSDLIARRILLAHEATLGIGTFADNRTGSLTLTFPAD